MPDRPRDECIGGTLARQGFVHRFDAAGFADVPIHATADCFARSPSDSARRAAACFGARSLTMLSGCAHVIDRGEGVYHKRRGGVHTHVLKDARAGKQL